MADPLLDHLVFATDDLESTVAAFEAATGVVPALGGRHVGLGTRNYLVGFGPTAYLEIIGPDLEQPEVEPGSMPFGVGELRGTRLVTWAVHPVDLEASLAAAREVGADLGEIRPMSRATPAGDVLSWRLTSAHPAPLDGLVPFLIDWSSTRHPAESGLPQVSLLDFTATHPDPPAVTAALDALGVSLPITAGLVALHAEVRGPAGVVALS